MEHWKQKDWCKDLWHHNVGPIEIIYTSSLSKNCTHIWRKKKKELQRQTYSICTATGDNQYNIPRSQNYHGHKGPRICNSYNILVFTMKPNREKAYSSYERITTLYRRRNGPLQTMNSIPNQEYESRSLKQISQQLLQPLLPPATSSRKEAVLQ